MSKAEDNPIIERDLLRALLENLPDVIFFKDLNFRFVRFSRSTAEQARASMLTTYRAAHPLAQPEDLPEHLGSPERFAEYLIGKTDADVFSEERARSSHQDEQRIISTGEPLVNHLKHTNETDGRARWRLTTKMPWRDETGNIIGIFGISRDITAQKEAEARLEAVHKRMVDNARLLGEADLAAEVLHNVGNILNSANVSCTLMIDKVKASKSTSLSKVASLLTNERDRCGEYLTSDPRGRMIPYYLSNLADQLAVEQVSLLNELSSLHTHMVHIAQYVASQRPAAPNQRHFEEANLVQLVEDALSLYAGELEQARIGVRKEFEPAPAVVTDRHKVLQILINLIGNAKGGLAPSSRPDKWLQIGISCRADNFVAIEVVDNGVGLSEELVAGIFSQGFETNQNSYGGGLHRSALAAADVRGSLKAESKGPGQGARFTLLLPRDNPVSVADEEQK
jgi:signal transduction histidine kinase